MKFFIRLAIRFIQLKINDIIICGYKPGEYFGDDRSRFKLFREAKAIAHAIYDIECAGWETKKEWRKEGKKSWDLASNIWMTRSEDYMCWYIWRNYSDQARTFCKIIPAFDLPSANIEKLLRYQPWVCL